MIINRIATDLFLFLLLFLAPWWLYLVLLLAAMFVWPLFAEALFFGFILDIYYFAGLSHFPYNVIFTSTAFLLLLILPYLKANLRFYQ